MPSGKRSTYIRRNHDVRPAKRQGQFNFKVNDTMFRPSCQQCGGKVFSRMQRLKEHLKNVHKFSSTAINEILGVNDLEDNEEVVVVEEENEDEEVEENDYDEEVAEDDIESYEVYNNLVQQIGDTNYGSNNTEEEDEEEAIQLIEGIASNESCCSPFPNLQTMIMQAFVDGDHDMVSRRQLRKILFTISLLFKVKDGFDADNNNAGKKFKLPSLDYLCAFESRKKMSKLPSFP